MKNLTEVLEKAVSQETMWAVSSFFEILEIIDNTDFKISFWEGEENWATILKNNVVIGYIWKKYPFISIQSDFFHQITSIINSKSYIYCIEVESLNTELLLYDKRLLEKYFGREFYQPPLTMEDLWFQTNTD